MSIGEIIFLARRRDGVKSSEFAKTHHISRATLWRIESGKSKTMPISIAEWLLYLKEKGLL